MSLNTSGGERHAKTLRAWQLAILRFAVTLDNADGLTDGHRRRNRQAWSRAQQTGFQLFRKTSAELCAAILRPNELTSNVLRQHLAQIDEDRLKHVFAATIEANQPMVSLVGKPFKRDNGLCRSDI
jgi:hypothetical protein